MTTRDTVLVLGTGATLGGCFEVVVGGTKFQPPLDKNFFETPAVQHIFNSEQYPALAHYQLDGGLESTWATVDLYHKLCRTGIISEESTNEKVADALQQRANGEQAYRMKMEQEDRRWLVPSMAGWELLKLVSTVFQGLRHPKIQESPLYKLVDGLCGKGLLGVVSFNYDTSLELLLRDRFYYPLLEGEDASCKLPLLKLHGSLNWQTDSRGKPPNYPTVVGPPTNIADMKHGAGWYMQPEIIGPTFFKQEITLDFEIPGGDFRARYYKRLWRNAWDLLRRARYLVFVGFSFPQTDFHVKALFHTAHLSGSGFRRVILCHQNDQNIQSTAEQVFVGRPTKFTCFPQGLESMAERVDEVMALVCDSTCSVDVNDRS